MSNAYLPLVNQKLAYIRQLLSLAQTEAVTLSQRQANLAIVDAACLELAAAYRCFVRELASHYRLANVQSVDSASVALKGLEALSVSSPELQECHSLEFAEDHADNWLADALHHAAVSLNPVPQAKDKGLSSPAGQLISAVDLGKAGQEPLSLESIQRWYQSFYALVERHREGIQEF